MTLAVKWSDWSDKAMVEDALCTALRGGEGGGCPMARGNLHAQLEHSASWHIKVVQRASNNGKIYVGIETADDKGLAMKDEKDRVMLIGEDWFHASYVDKAVYYSSDGDICRGNQVVDSTGITYGSGDVIGIQIADRQLTFLKNGDPVGEPLAGLSAWVRSAVQMHRPGDKVLLVRELAGPAAGKDIARTKLLKEEKRKALEEEVRRQEVKRLEQLRRQEEKILQEKRDAELEEQRKREKAEQEEKRKQEEEMERIRAAEAEILRKQKQDEEKKRIADLRRAKQAKEEAARKKAAEEQIKKVARSRGGYYEEEPDPDAPDEAEIQDFLRNCLPLRLTAAKQMGLPALPVASKVASMKVMLTPQQHYAIKKHLTEVKKARKSKQETSTAAAEVERIDTPGAS